MNLNRINITIKGSNMQKNNKRTRPCKKRYNNQIWLKHVKEVKELYPNLEQESLLKIASESYNSVEKSDAGYPKKSDPERYDWIKFWDEHKDKEEYSRLSYHKKRYAIMKLYDKTKSKYKYYVSEVESDNASELDDMTESIDEETTLKFE